MEPIRLPISTARFVYRFIFPITTLLLLLVISGGIPRPLLLGSSTIDFLARFWVSLIYCSGYIIVSDVNKFISWYYSGNIDKPSIVSDGTTILWSIFLSLMLGFFATLGSWWAIHIFLPAFNNHSQILAFINGLLFFVPMFSQRKQFRL